MLKGVKRQIVAKTKFKKNKTLNSTHGIDKEFIFLIDKELSKSIRKRTTRMDKNKIH